jgi:dTDP-4-amino-4,6-dideoxygalactose transaminase
MRNKLAREGIAAGRYCGPIHFAPAWRDYASQDVGRPVTERIACHTPAPPFFNRIRAGHQQEGIEAV